MRAIGCFYIFKLINMKKSLILCYHGISLKDEHQFRPATFVTIERLKHRIRKLKKKNYCFISLEQLHKNMKKNTLSNKDIVITIDDGFTSIFDDMIPFLEKQKIPNTLYITTMNSKNENSIFRLMASYIFWKTDTKKVEVADLKLSKEISQNTLKPKDRENYWNFIQEVEKIYLPAERNEVYLKLQKRLNVHISPCTEKSFSIIDLKRVKKMDLNYTDIQLHTHTHDMSLPLSELEEDILKNKAYLEPVAKSRLEHFCYPSGQYSKSHFPLLRKLGIKTATTCELGLVSNDTLDLEIPRLVINSNMPEIVFEAELCGLMTFIRQLRRKLSPN